MKCNLDAVGNWADVGLKGKVIGCCKLKASESCKNLHAGKVRPAIKNPRLWRSIHSEGRNSMITASQVDFSQVESTRIINKKRYFVLFDSDTVD